MATVYEGPRLVSTARRRAQILRAVPSAPAVDEREGLPPPGAPPVSVVALLRAPALDPPSEVDLQPPFGADPLPSPAHEQASPPFWEPGPRASPRRRRAGDGGAPLRGATEPAQSRRGTTEPAQQAGPPSPGAEDQQADGRRTHAARRPAPPPQADAQPAPRRLEPSAGGAARTSRNGASPPLRCPRDTKRPATGTERTDTEHTGAERVRSAAVAYLVERELRVNGLSSTQVGRPQAERRLFVARAAAEVDVESSIHQVTAWAALRLFVGMCVEVLNGYRPAGQLRPMSDPHRFTDIADQLVRRTVRVRMSPAQAARQGRLVRVRRMLVCEPLPGIAEAAVVLEQGDTCWSMAVRMERTARTAEPTSWRCVLVQVI